MLYAGVAPKIIFAIAIVAWFNVFLNRKRINIMVYYIIMIILPIVLFVALKATMK